jgi:hypothetical protein
VRGLWVTWTTLEEYWLIVLLSSPIQLDPTGDSPCFYVSLFLPCYITSRATFIAVAMQHVASNPYMLRDEYVDLRNRQDTHLNQELHSIRASVDGVGQDLRDFKVEVNTQFTKVDTQFTELRVELLRLNAYVRNTALRIPTMRIQPLPAYDPDRGAILPQFFPKHWKEFCSLRDPSSPSSHRMLVYLARFYDIPLNAEPGSESESSDDELVVNDPDRVVESWSIYLVLTSVSSPSLKEKLAN